MKEAYSFYTLFKFGSQNLANHEGIQSELVQWIASYGDAIESKGAFQTSEEKRAWCSKMIEKLGNQAMAEVINTLDRNAMIRYCRFLSLPILQSFGNDVAVLRGSILGHWRVRRTQLNNNLDALMREFEDVYIQFKDPSKSRFQPTP